MNNPYIFGVAVVILLVCLYYAYTAYSNTVDGTSTDLSVVITSLVTLSAYCSMSFLYLSTK